MIGAHHAPIVGFFSTPHKIVILSERSEPKDPEELGLAAKHRTFFPTNRLVRAIAPHPQASNPPPRPLYPR